VVPSISILAEPSVAVVDKVVDRRGTRQAAEAYLNFLYSEEGQQLAAKHYFRPRAKEILEQHVEHFTKVELMDIAAFGGWKQVQKIHFSDGGTFDGIYGSASATK
jgi:ABC-type sulfate transport system substrate-binding protein